ncbi:enhancer of mRNA-decapping protein 4 [Chaetomidium leptoderma]|uniref:Enhancer of mRNA-decapping protein 4 n=1 Tax=Chaetomidium leptoderma TaxID=669021 RepID=A0AAN6ZTF6_9PEZI|nr:enhancer of mRNA-decapping protein 4 [Chaetomidium leptoderma]
MRATLIVVAATLGLVDAASNILIPYGALNKRQAFDPDETTGNGANCVEAFGEGYIECVPPTASRNRLCINPDLGETCCSNLWGCPSDSFCLVQDLCCPTGLDPTTCAAQNDVTLPPDFSAPATSFVAAPSDTPSGTVIAPPITTTAPGGQGNATATRGTSKPPIQTAGARHEHAGVVAAVLGLAAAFAL